MRSPRTTCAVLDAALDAGSRNDSPRCCTYGAMTRYGLFVFVLCCCVRVSSGTTRDFGACSNVRAERGQYRECPSVWCVSADANTILRNIYCVRDTNASPMVQWSDRACVMLVRHPDPLSGYPNIGSRCWSFFSSRKPYVIFLHSTGFARNTSWHACHSQKRTLAHPSDHPLHLTNMDVNAPAPLGIRRIHLNLSCR